MNGSRIEKSRKDERRGFHQPSNYKGGPLAQSKMPQRPGSSKPTPKSNLLDEGPNTKGRPESPSSNNKFSAKHAANKASRLRSASPNTMQQRKDSAKNDSGRVQQRKVSTPVAGSRPRTKGVQGYRLGASNPGTVIATAAGKYVNAKNLQNNYMRGYSPSKPLWK